MKFARRFRTNIRLLRACLAWACGIALFAPTVSFAIIGGEGVDPNSDASPWLGVGSIVIGSGIGSGTLIAPNYVITAAHAVIGAAGNPSSVTFRINGTTTTLLTADQIFINPAYDGVASADGITRNDLAIIRLSSPAPVNVPFYSLYSAQIATHTRLKLVGYGSGGDGVGGATTGYPDPAVKRTGENKADVLLPYGPANDTYLFDFDGPDYTTNLFGPNISSNGTLGASLEATLGPDDSGGGAFVLDNGIWKLAGVNTFIGSITNGASAPLFGSLGGGMLISAQTDWINSVITTPVPEPQTWLMLLPGLLGIVVMRRQRRI